MYSGNGAKKCFYIIFILFFCGISTSNIAKELIAKAEASSIQAARAEALKQLAESIQVSVEGNTTIDNQMHQNEFTSRLSEQIKTSTNISLLGVEFSEQFDNGLFTIVAKLDTQKSFYAYLQKLNLDSQLIAASHLAFLSNQDTSLKSIAAFELVNKLTEHMQDYLVAGMLAENQDPAEWQAKLKSEVSQLIELQNYLEGLRTSPQTNERLIATLLTLGSNRKNVTLCPIYSTDGSVQTFDFKLYQELKAQLVQSVNPDNADFALISTIDDKFNGTITARLVDKSGLIVHQNTALLTNLPTDWQTEIEDPVRQLLVVNYRHAESAKLDLDVMQKRARERVAANLSTKNNFVLSNICTPPNLFSLQALHNIYGLNKMVVLDIDAKIGSFVLRPDPKEHQFALANLIYRELDLLTGAEQFNKNLVGKKFPVLDANEAILEAIDIGLRKL